MGDGVQREWSRLECRGSFGAPPLPHPQLARRAGMIVRGGRGASAGQEGREVAPGEQRGAVCRGPAGISSRLHAATRVGAGLGRVETAPRARGGGRRERAGAGQRPGVEQGEAEVAPDLGAQGVQARVLLKKEKIKIIKNLIRFFLKFGYVNAWLPSEA